MFTHSTKSKTVICSFVSAKGPSVTATVPLCTRTNFPVFASTSRFSMSQPHTATVRLHDSTVRVGPHLCRIFIGKLDIFVSAYEKQLLCGISAKKGLLPYSYS